MKQKRVTVLQYNAIFTEEPEGGFSVRVPELPGCISQGDTFEEAQRNITEAIQLYLEDVDTAVFGRRPSDPPQEFMVPIRIQMHA